MEDAVSIFHQVYDVAIDDKHTRETLLAGSEGVNSNSADVGKGFANMRKHYRTRRECSAYKLRLSQQISAQIQQTLEQLGFTLEIAGE
jgi:erythronate-4-phosphate dehydrogenase